MNCMRQCISQTLSNGYSHPIQRLMVTGMSGARYPVFSDKTYRLRAGRVKQMLRCNRIKMSSVVNASRLPSSYPPFPTKAQQ